MASKNTSRRGAVIAAASLASAALLIGGAGGAEAAQAPTNPAKLKKSCTLWFNYTPHQAMDKAPGHSVPVQAGKGRTVNYRYNWDSHYAVVSTWGSSGVWGFINRSCLGRPKHAVGGRLTEHLSSSAEKHTRYMCGQQTLYVRDHQQRVIGRLYHGDRFVQYGKTRKMKKDNGRISVGYAYGRVHKPGRVYTKYLSTKPCPSAAAAPAAAAAAPAPAPAARVAAGSAVPASRAVAADCHYKVTWPVAGVYEQPTNASTLLKDKRAGDIVGGYCDWTYDNTTEGHTYLAVATDSAADGIGWMRRDALVKL
ncbi:hypothetical protein NE235_29410 [Actinoallomurus spadix]|uniref:Uncharacterized protein n=1 Tax=Actinoallomurus spadix TaxID=79912 RepID=A0ABN0XS85_9ACTN|nr:hypothetical protein [Actinoallomurus spadix]MCO5990239.1 hypothetical protein [Actinoallomurus spadix]